MAVGPVQERSVDVEKAKMFVQRYRIAEIKETIKARHTGIDYFNSYYNYSDPWREVPMSTYTHVRVFSMEIEESMFSEIINKIAELDELMRDPETAKLLHEAKFIHRLKRGHF